MTYKELRQKHNLLLREAAKALDVTMRHWQKLEADGGEVKDNHIIVFNARIAKYPHLLKQKTAQRDHGSNDF